MGLIPTTTTKLKLLPHFRGEMPRYETAFAAGFDIPSAEDYFLPPGARVIVPTGMELELDPLYHLEIRARSGYAAKRGIGVLNSPGTIDPDYRGEIKVILVNHGTGTFYINRGMRIAQGVLVPMVRTNFEVVSDLSETARGDGGFGSTGTGAE